MRFSSFLVVPIALVGCGKPEPSSTPAKPDQVPPISGDPAPQPKKKTKTTQTPAEIAWETNFLKNAPGYLMPCDDAEKADPAKALERLQKDLATDQAANDLLKKLIRVETLTFVVGASLAPEKIDPSGPPKSEDDGVVTVYLQPGKTSVVKGRTLLDFYYSVASSRSSTLFANVDNLDPIRFTINDFLLRNSLGYVFRRGRADQWQPSQATSAEMMRKELDTEITEFLKKNAQHPLKVKK